MTRIADALRTLREGEPIPALRPIYTALANEAAMREEALVDFANRLVDTTDTLDYESPRLFRRAPGLSQAAMGS